MAVYSLQNKRLTRAFSAASPIRVSDQVHPNIVKCLRHGIETKDRFGLL